MRIGINVPNELIQRIKAVQPDVNISQVCREAIQNLAKTHESVTDWLANDGSIERVMEFARAHEEKYQGPDWEALGFGDAREWVATIPEAGWDALLRRCNWLERRGRDDFDVLVGGNQYHWNEKGFRYHENENSDWFERMYDLKEQYGLSTNFRAEAEQKYEKAWVAYVIGVRTRYLDYLKDMRVHALAEREQVSRSRPVPEVPQHLMETAKTTLAGTSVRSRRIVMWDFQNVAVAASDIQRVDTEIMDTLNRICASADHDLFKAFCHPDQHAATAELRKLKWRVKKRTDDIDQVLVQECKSDCGQSPDEVVLVICTKDGDFAPLVKEMRDWGVEVYVMGPKGTNKRLIETAGSHWIELK